MKSLVFQELMILSKTEKRARKVCFDPKKNLIVGENDVGKSTLIKSLYHALGAETPQLNNNRWRKANPIYCLRFMVGGLTRTIVRDERYFSVFDDNLELLGRYQGASADKGVGSAINALLGFNIELETKEGRMRAASCAYYFLPFYVDQDEGWNTCWSSFAGLQGVKEYRKKLMDYHLGIRPQAHYDAVKQLHKLNIDWNQLSGEKSALISVRDRYKERKAHENVDLDPAAFRAEVDELVVKVNEVYERQQAQLKLVKDARNRRLGLQNEIRILELSVRELEADYKFIEKPTTPDEIDCPTCGTHFENSLAQRFGILDDIDYCKSLIDQKKKSLISVDDEMKAHDARYAEITSELKSVEALLQREKEHVTLAEVIRAEGYKDVMQSMAADISTIDRNQEEIERAKEAIQPQTRVDRELKERVFDFYRSRMKESLNKLNVHVLREADYKTPDRTIKANALGSDLPRSLLAQYVSLLHTMNKFNSFTVCPLVIDSPLQQEQDDTNVDAIFDFIFRAPIDDQQLVLGTLRMNDFLKDKRSEETFSVIEFTDKYHLLADTEYDEVLAHVEPLQEMTLATDA